MRASQSDTVCCCRCKCHAPARGAEDIPQGKLIRSAHKSDFIRTAAGIVDVETGAFYYTHHVRDWMFTVIPEGEVIHLSN